MFKKELPPNKKVKTDHLFKNYELWVDLGFLGIETDYEGNIKTIVIPEKKPRKSKKNPEPELTEKQEEKIKSKVSAVMEIACGLWNFHLDFESNGLILRYCAISKEVTFIQFLK